MSSVRTTTQLLTLKDAADITPYSAEYLNLLARKKKLNARKIGRDWLITKPDLFDYLKKQQTESQSRLVQLSKYLRMLL